MLLFHYAGSFILLVSTQPQELIYLPHTAHQFVHIEAISPKRTYSSSQVMVPCLIHYGHNIKIVRLWSNSQLSHRLFIMNQLLAIRLDLSETSPNILIYSASNYYTIIKYFFLTEFGYQFLLNLQYLIIFDVFLNDEIINLFCVLRVIKLTS